MGDRVGRDFDRDMPVSGSYAASLVITIVDYGLGNVGSVANMLKKIGSRVEVATSPDAVARAAAIILPGVGHFDQGMKNLGERGLLGVLNDRVLGAGVPVLGICLGVQLMARGSEEGSEAGLGWLAADVKRFRLDPRLPVPHMGWNEVDKVDPDLFEGADQPRFYFVHSYHLVCDDARDVAAWTTYGYRFASAVRHDRMLGTQFHPEKSHRWGMTVLKNFVRIATHD